MDLLLFTKHIINMVALSFTYPDFFLFPPDILAVFVKPLLAFCLVTDAGVAAVCLGDVCGFESEEVGL